MVLSGCTDIQNVVDVSLVKTLAYTLLPHGYMHAKALSTSTCPHVLLPAAFFNSTAAGGVFNINVKLRSS